MKFMKSKICTAFRTRIDRTIRMGRGPARWCSWEYYPEIFTMLALFKTLLLFPSNGVECCMQ